RRPAVPGQPHAREGKPRLAQQALRQWLEQRRREVMHMVVVIRAEAWEVLGREARFVALAVAAEERCTVVPRPIETNVVAVVVELLVARVEVVVGVAVEIRLDDILLQYLG